ncbi:MAG: PepSY-like domain-containing protein [Bacteroidales bacterium]
MKKVFLIIVMLFSMQCMVFAQLPVKESDVPEVVKSKLPNLFPGVTGVQWIRHNTDYHAAFSYDNIKVVVKFAESGRWINSESEYEIEDCPRSMQKHVTTSFANTKVVRILLTENKDISEYNVEMLDTLTKQPLFAMYDISGAFVRKSDSKGNDIDLQLQGASERGKLAVHPKELPSAINSYVIINYSQYSIRESYIVNNEKYQNAYYVVLGKSDDKVPVELWFDFQGTPIAGANKPVSDSGDQKDQDKGQKKQTRTPFPQSKVPAAAVQYFTKKEPKAEEVRWDTLGLHYVASYYNPIRSTENRMHFDKKGAFVMSVVVLNPKDLLPLAQNYLMDNYPDLEIESAENLVYADKKKYTLVKLYGPTWMNDPMVFHEIYFSTSGRLEKEVLANFIDAEDVYLREKRENQHAAFNEVTAEDDLSLEEGNNLDGQSVTHKELPSQSIKYIAENYPGWSFTEGVIISDENVLKYSVFIKRDGYREHKRLLFDMKGSFLKEEDL